MPAVQELLLGWGGRASAHSACMPRTAFCISWDLLESSGFGCSEVPVQACRQCMGTTQLKLALISRVIGARSSLWRTAS